MNSKERHINFLNALQDEFKNMQMEKFNKAAELKNYQESVLDHSTELVRSNIQKENKRSEISSSRDKIKSTLMINALDYILNEALKKLDINDVTNNRLGYLNQFISEQESITRFLRESKTKNFILSQMVFELEKSYKSIVENNKEEDVQVVIKIDNKDVEEYIDKLDKLECDRIAEIIADKVSVSIADFIINNQKDKQEIQKTIIHSQEKIEKTIDESKISYYQTQCKSEIKKIRNKRFKSLFEMMISNVAEYTYKNNVKEFINEGSLELNKIMESVTIMYTFLEFTNTLGLVTVNESYIKDVLKQMK